MYDLVFVSSPLITETPFTTSLVISKYAQVEHKAIRQLISKYKNRLEKMGKVTFQMSPLESGQKTKVYILNELQATFLITLLKNTEKVVNFKEKLSEQFYEMKNELTKRNVLKEMEKPIRKELTQAIKEWEHFNPYAYSQITDLIAKAVTGKITRVIKKERGIVGNVSTLQLYSSEELEQYQRIESQVVALLELGLTYGEMKGILLKRKEMKKDEAPTDC